MDSKRSRSTQKPSATATRTSLMLFGRRKGGGPLSLSRFGMNATSGDVVRAVLACILLQVLLPVILKRWEVYSSCGRDSKRSRTRTTASRFLLLCRSPSVLHLALASACRTLAFSMLTLLRVWDPSISVDFLSGDKEATQFSSSTGRHPRTNPPSDNAIASDLNVPGHIAIIMDGNRRHGKDVYGDATRGHADGGRTLSRVIDWCLELGVQVVTVYAFSTENWNRDPAEIDLLMNIFEREAEEILRESLQRGVRVRVLSSQPERLPASVRQKFAQLERETESGERLVLNLCVSYGGRDEIVGACRRVAARVESGELRSDDINESVLGQEMLTARCAPGSVNGRVVGSERKDMQSHDPDVVIRTSGERRLSNFLLWQVAYSELIFIEKHWPAVQRADFLEVLQEYSRRKRRFGK